MNRELSMEFVRVTEAALDAATKTVLTSLPLTL